jgi:hypothetical protein
VQVVAGAEDGTLPAWALPYPQYTAVEASAEVLSPGLGQVFAAAACCDLLLVGLLGGDAEAEDGALAVLRAEHADMAWSLLTWAVTGTLEGAAAGCLTVASSTPLLPVEVLSELAGLYVSVLIDGCKAPGSARR